MKTKITRDEARFLLHALSPLRYIESLGFRPYGWQARVLESPHKRKVINGARQAGKSTIVSAKPCHTAKHFEGSLSLIIAATERQAFLDMEKVKAFISRDPDYPEKLRVSDQLVTLANGSWIMVVPATETSARGASAPRLILLDEASRIDDIVYRSGVIPMLTGNPDCELVSISTPNGRSGFFFDSFNSPAWERYEVRSPWDAEAADFRLAPARSEAEYREARARAGVLAWHSPRHSDLAEQSFNLNEMGPLMYRQEYCCEFVEPGGQVFGYDEIERMMDAGADAIDLGGTGDAEPLIL